MPILLPPRKLGSGMGSSHCGTINAASRLFWQICSVFARCVCRATASRLRAAEHQRPARKKSRVRINDQGLDSQLEPIEHTEEGRGSQEIAGKPVIARGADPLLGESDGASEYRVRPKWVIGRNRRSGLCTRAGFDWYTTCGCAQLLGTIGASALLVPGILGHVIHSEFQGDAIW
jgi:hypothetical protein